MAANIDQILAQYWQYLENVRVQARLVEYSIPMISQHCLSILSQYWLSLEIVVRAFSAKTLSILSLHPLIYPTPSQYSFLLGSTILMLI